jgi:hypothetical protein
LTADKRNRAKLRLVVARRNNINANIGNKTNTPGRSNFANGRTNLFDGRLLVSPNPAAVVVIASVNGVFGEFAGSDEGVKTHAESAGKP